MCGHGEFSTRTHRQQRARQRRSQLNQAQNTTNNVGKHAQAAAATIAYAQKKHMLIITIKNQKFTCVVMVNLVRARTDINVCANAGANSIKRNTASTRRLSCRPASELLNTPG